MSEPMPHSSLREAVARVLGGFDAVQYDMLTPDAREWWCVIADATLAAVAEAAGGRDVLTNAAALLAYQAGAESECGAHTLAAMGRRGAALLRALADAGASR